MNLVASEKAISVITDYCNKNSIAFEKLNSQTLRFEKVTDVLHSYCRGVIQPD